MRGSNPDRGKRFISFSKLRDRPWGPLSLLFSWSRGLFLRGGVSRPGREADHWLLSGAEVKNEWSHTSTFPHIFMGFYFLKHGDKFTWNLGCIYCPLLKRLQCSSLYTVPYWRDCNVVPYIISLTQGLQCSSLYTVPYLRDYNVVPYILSLTQEIAM